MCRKDANRNILNQLGSVSLLTVSLEYVGWISLIGLRLIREVPGVLPANHEAKSRPTSSNLPWQKNRELRRGNPIFPLNDSRSDNRLC